MRTIIFGFLAWSALAAATASAAEPVFRSGPGRVALIELYTSEGCSSCPPAEKWLGGLRDDAGLWQTFVPVAFHVNYWDHLGWRDALATKAFTDREHAYARAWGAETVYTPCFVRNGSEWHPNDRLRADRGAPEAGTLVLTWQTVTNTCRVEFTPGAANAKAAKLDISVALLGGGIVSDVRKGENAGRELRHEFVALRLETVPLVRAANGTWTASAALPPRTDVSATRLAVAAWVVPRGDIIPLQAAGGWIKVPEHVSGLNLP